MPRLFEALQSMFADAVAEERAKGSGEEAATATVVARFRSADGPLGDRICHVGTGSAPVPPSLKAFMDTVWSHEHGGASTVTTGYAIPQRTVLCEIGAKSTLRV